MVAITLTVFLVGMCGLSRCLYPYWFETSKWGGGEGSKPVNSIILCAFTVYWFTPLPMHLLVSFFWLDSTGYCFLVYPPPSCILLFTGFWLQISVSFKKDSKWCGVKRRAADVLLESLVTHW